MARVKKSCLTLTNWTFGSLTSDINYIISWRNCGAGQKNIWTYYGKSDEILSYSDKLDI